MRTKERQALLNEVTRLHKRYVSLSCKSWDIISHDEVCLKIEKAITDKINLDVMSDQDFLTFIKK